MFIFSTNVKKIALLSHLVAMAIMANQQFHLFIRHGVSTFHVSKFHCKSHISNVFVNQHNAAGHFALFGPDIWHMGWVCLQVIWHHQQVNDKGICVYQMCISIARESIKELQCIICIIYFLRITF